MLATKQIIEGVIITDTPTHYVTSTSEGRHMWNKKYYRIVQEVEPQTSLSQNWSKE